LASLVISRRALLVTMASAVARQAATHRLVGLTGESAK
jgi:hypothetical protein